MRDKGTLILTENGRTVASNATGLREENLDLVPVLARVLPRALTDGRNERHGDLGQSSSQTQTVSTVMTARQPCPPVSHR